MVAPGPDANQADNGLVIVFSLNHTHEGTGWKLGGRRDQTGLV